MNHKNNSDMPEFMIRATVIDVETNVRSFAIKNCRKKVINKDDNINKSQANKHGMIFVYRG